MSKSLIFLTNDAFSFHEKNLAYQLRYENNDNRMQFLGEAEWMNLADVAVIKTTDVMVFQIHHKATDKVNFSEWVKGVIPEYTCKSRQLRLKLRLQDFLHYGIGSNPFPKQRGLSYPLVLLHTLPCIWLGYVV